MYAAAGGAVKQARKRQQLQTVKDKAEQARLVKEKLEAAEAAKLASHPKSRHFHQLPANYLRAPHTPHGRKLSVGYTGHGSKLLLPISEQSAQHHSPSQQTLHHHQRHGHHYTNEPRTPTIGHREMEHKKLARSATASFPLVSHAGTPPASPGICFRQHQHFFKQSQSNLLSAQQHHLHIQIPQDGNEGIIITPATPLPSPSPSSNQLKQQQQHRTEAQPIVDDMPEFPLERACSVYRNRKLEANEPSTVDMDDEYQLQQQFYPGGMPNGNGAHHTHWADELCEAESRAMGVCTCDHIEVKVNSMSFVMFWFFFRFFSMLMFINHLHVHLHLFSVSRAGSSCP